jgi:LPXTG-motif cell wall-anchored protein
VGNDGKVVITLTNTGEPGKVLPVRFVVEEGDTTIVDELVEAGIPEQVVLDDLSDGSHTFTVTADGEPLPDLVVDVRCDAPGIPVVDSGVECTADGGQVTLTLGNDGASGTNLPVEFTVTDPRTGEVTTVTVAADDTETVVLEGFLDGTWTIPVTADGEALDQTVTVRCADPQVEGIALGCAEGGFVVRVGNDGTNPTTMTFLKGSSVVEEVVVDPDSTVEVLIPMVEGETADITVLDGDEVLTEQTVTMDCIDPTTTTTTPSAEVRGSVQTAPPVTPAGALPYTGGDVLRLVALGLGLALAGAGLVVAVRRRRA